VLGLFVSWNALRALGRRGRAYPSVLDTSNLSKVDRRLVREAVVSHRELPREPRLEGVANAYALEEPIRGPWFIKMLSLVFGGFVLILSIFYLIPDAIVIVLTVQDGLLILVACSVWMSFHGIHKARSYAAMSHTEGDPAGKDADS
jgi:hypothetical protein